MENDRPNNEPPNEFDPETLISIIEEKLNELETLKKEGEEISEKLKNLLREKEMLDTWIEALIPTIYDN